MKNIYPTIQSFIESVESKFDTIPQERKERLDQLSHLIKNQLKTENYCNLNFICTHNSRRSILGQVWTHVAASHYAISNIQSYSGGTENTAVYREIINTLSRTGLQISEIKKGENPVYALKYTDTNFPIISFSKTFDHAYNPVTFIAVMTCTDADENCPFIPAASHRFSLPYADPKYADNTPDVQVAYDAKSVEIATEIFYLFSGIK